ncbi:hypothetical protein [Streptomyces sp. NPDC089919]|uniref:hypothetical protein n=1 Tax=Streptomyces sp. NPDC089919 TaxID=3155188 RepID=UPI00342CA6B0
MEVLKTWCQRMARHWEVPRELKQDGETDWAYVERMALLECPLNLPDAQVTLIRDPLFEMTTYPATQFELVSLVKYVASHLGIADPYPASDQLWDPRWGNLPAQLPYGASPPLLWNGRRWVPCQWNQQSQSYELVDPLPGPPDGAGTSGPDDFEDMLEKIFRKSVKEQIANPEFAHIPKDVLALAVADGIVEMMLEIENGKH